MKRDAFKQATVLETTVCAVTLPAKKKALRRNARCY
jgi:hypothetical protein